MTAKSKDKTLARSLQEETGWTYSECLRLVRIALAEGIEVGEVLRREGRTRSKEKSK